MLLRSTNPLNWKRLLTSSFILVLYFDAVKLSHLVDAEYGNQGIDFKMVPREGFGWMNGEYPTILHSILLPLSSCGVVRI